MLWCVMPTTGYPEAVATNVTSAPNTRPEAPPASNEVVETTEGGAPTGSAGSDGGGGGGGVVGQLGEGGCTGHPAVTVSPPQHCMVVGVVLGMLCVGLAALLVGVVAVWVWSCRKKRPGTKPSPEGERSA